MSSSIVSREKIGIAGAYYVAGELSQRGYIATLTSRNTKGVDILVASHDGLRAVSIQVKTSSSMSPSRKWPFHDKDEHIFSSNLYYTLVHLRSDNVKPDIYIVPSKFVAEYIRKSHADWLLKRSIRGQEHRDNPMRTFKFETDLIAFQYLNKWENLGLE